MVHLDLVVSVCSGPAHLAGALGVAVWVPGSANADWRWLLGREDSPWYPTMRLFRQDHLGVWEPVFERMAAELSNLVRTRASERSAKVQVAEAITTGKSAHFAPPASGYVTASAGGNSPLGNS